MIAVIELRDLKYLVTLAEELHMGSAADRLGITQPALSYGLRRMEQDAGLQLFHRHARGLQLTTHGLTLVDRARAILAAVAEFEATAESCRKGENQFISVGFVATGAGPIMTEARTLFHRRNPTIEVIPKRLEWAEEVKALHERRVDIAFVWLPATLAGLEYEVVHTEPRSVAFSLHHPLAGKKSLSILDVKDEPLMRTDRVSSEWESWWAVNPRPDGSSPTWGPNNDNVEEMLERVAEGVAICFAPSSMATYYGRPDLAWAELYDIEPLQVAIAWRQDETRPSVSLFIDTVREVHGNHT